MMNLSRKVFINISGTNATGKTTRVNYLVDWLKSSAKEVVPILYLGKEKGLLFKQVKGKTIAVLGVKDKSGRIVGWDSIGITKIKDRIKFVEYVMQELNADIVIVEGYFNNRVLAYSPDKFSFPVEVIGIIFVYNSKKELQARLRERNKGKDKGNVEKVWGYNKGFLSHLAKAKEISTFDFRIEKELFNSSKEVLVEKYLKPLLTG